MSPADTAATPTRLARLLAMVPYFLAHPGISAHAAAQDLNISVEELIADLNQLWVCGLPGYSPGDLIDLDFEGGEHINVIFSAGMDRPLRLTSAEASVLLVALRALLDMGGVLDPDAARRAVAKIDTAVGAGARPQDSPPAGPDDDGPADTGPAAVVRAAVADGRSIWIRYYSASRDAVSERVVDPVLIQAVDGHSYLQAWCRASLGVRLFRLDRIDDARRRDEPAHHHPETATGGGLALFSAGSELPSAEIEIDRSVAWVLDYHLMEPVGDPAADPADRLLARMTYASEEWLTRFLAGFGGRIRVRNTPGVADEIRHRAQTALAAYESTG